MQKTLTNEGLTTGEVHRIVNRYLGVNVGYLADFTYSTHHDFYLELDLEIDPYDYEGTTRQRFIAILSESPTTTQARILEGVLEKYPPGSSDLRTEERAAWIRQLIARLRGAAPVSSPELAITTEVVERAINDAELLIQTAGATSGVDRVHTALHGYLRAACAAHHIDVKDNAGINELFKALRREHPALADTGPRGQDIVKILRSLAAVMDSLNPVRNRASVAHPNVDLLEEPEAMLVINAARSILHYLDAKLGAVT